MRSVLKSACLSVLAALLLYAMPVSAPQASVPPQEARAFGPGERLTFAISYLGMRAGTAVMNVREGEPLNGRPTWKLQTLAWSEGVVASFFPVDDRVESIVDAQTLLPYHMVFDKREGKKASHIEVVFDHAAGTATTVKDGVRSVAEIPPGTQHAFSALYFLRDRPSVQVGEAMTLNVHHDAKNYPLNARVEKLERVRGGWGRQDAFEVKVLMPFRGIWMNEGAMQIWVTPDAQHVPLKVRAKVVIGSILAELVEGP